MKIKLSILGLLFVTAVSAQNTFSIKGQMDKMGETVEKVFLYYRAGNESKTDSVLVKDGKYNFSGTIDEPVMGRLRAVYPDLADGKKRAISFKKDYVTIFL